MSKRTEKSKIKNNLKSKSRNENDLKEKKYNEKYETVENENII